MQKFVLRFLKFGWPFLAILIFLILLDPFRVFRSYDDFYDGAFVTLNREFICVNTFKKNNPDQHFDSFIFGNSKSQAYQCNQWKKHLSDNASPFHFDANGEGIVGVRNKIVYLDKIDNPIRNALFVIDGELLSGIEEKQSHIYTHHPDLSDNTYIGYYTKFLRSSIDPEFFMSYVGFLLSHEKQPWMGSFIREPNYHFTTNPITADLRFAYEDQIKADSMGYYKMLEQKNVFYDVSTIPIDTVDFSDKTKNYLFEIARILKRKSTSFKIVVSPTYNQKKLSPLKVAYLEKVFGKESIYNFTGKNHFTTDITNWMESRHYKRYVANQIMDLIYR